MTTPGDPANDSSDWIFRSNINIKGYIVSINYDPPIVAQHVAVIRFDTEELALVEVMAYGKFYSDFRVYCLNIQNIVVLISSTAHI